MSQASSTPINLSNYVSTAPPPCSPPQVEEMEKNRLKLEKMYLSIQTRLREYVQEMREKEEEFHVEKMRAQSTDAVDEFQNAFRQINELKE